MICGVDEAGRGPVMGPLVVGCVYVEDDTVLRKIGVRDSKKLSPKVRERMYDEILSSVNDYSIVILEAKEIDERMKVKNLNEIEMDMFVEATTKIPTDAIYADCPDVDENRFTVELSSRTGNTGAVGRNKADDIYPVVSAASIIAKVTRDRLMDRISEKFGVDLGSGYPSDEKTMSFIRDWIAEHHSAPEYTRTCWEPIKKLLMVSRNTRITDW